MTDLEITRLCAEAMDLCEDERTTHTISYREEGHIWIRHEADPIGYRYSPLHDDAQAMALVKKFCPSMGHGSVPEEWHVHLREPDVWGNSEDLNRAICECVAKMQAAK